MKTITQDEYRDLYTLAVLARKMCRIQHAMRHGKVDTRAWERVMWDIEEVSTSIKLPEEVAYNFGEEPVFKRLRDTFLFKVEDE